MLPLYVDFDNRLPKRPYCCDHNGEHPIIRSRQVALGFRHIQFNDPTKIGWLLFDADHADADHCWEKAGLPAPNVFTQNRKNGRAHLAYAIKDPITGEACNGRDAPLDFAAAIERGMTKRLGADMAYCGFVSKNPKHPDFRSSFLATFPYGLNDLAKELSKDEMRRPRCDEEVSGIGRNCDTFNWLRRIAYEQIFSHRMDGRGFDEWRLRLEERAHQFNTQFQRPMGQAEVRTIAGSVAKWTWKKMHPEALRAKQSYSGSGATRRNREVVEQLTGEKDYKGKRTVASAVLAGMLGANKKHRRPVSMRTVRRVTAEKRQDYLDGSVERSKPWASQGISRSTYYRRAARLKA